MIELQVAIPVEIEDEARDLCRKAIKILDDRGWCQLTLVNISAIARRDPATGLLRSLAELQAVAPVCAVGALRSAYHGSVDPPEDYLEDLKYPYSLRYNSTALRVAEQRIESLIPYLDENPEWNAITTWNDQPGRTKNEVISVLRQVADQ